MSSKKVTLAALSLAALTGFIAGTARAEMATQAGTKAHKIVQARGAAADTGAGHENSCKGKNECKGKGGCKSGDNGCKGKNSCKGKGGCNASAGH